MSARAVDAIVDALAARLMPREATSSQTVLRAGMWRSSASTCDQRARDLGRVSPGFLGMRWSAMSSIIVRGLDDAVKQQLAAQAKEHGRSMEAEVRAILTKAARRPHIGIALLAAAQGIGGIEDLSIPARDDVARAVDFE